MGCRYVAFFAFVCLILLDFLTISAVPRSRRALREGDDIPVHHRVLGNTLDQAKQLGPFEETVQSFDRMSIKSSSNGFNQGERDGLHSTEDIYSYEGPVGTTLELTIENFAINNAGENYISAYAGSPLPEWHTYWKSANFRGTIPATLFDKNLLTSKLPYLGDNRNYQGADTYQHITGPKKFKSDSNLLTFRFIHNGAFSNSGDDVAYRAKITVLESDTKSKPGRIGRNSDPTTSSESFSICSDWNEELYKYQAAREIGEGLDIKSGSISSHAGMPNVDSLLPDQNCKVKLFIGEGNKLVLNMETWHFNEDNHDVCDDATVTANKEYTTYLRINDDLFCSGGEGPSGPDGYVYYGDHVEFEFNVNGWAHAAFLLHYQIQSLTASSDEESEEESDTPSANEQPETETPEIVSDPEMPAFVDNILPGMGMFTAEFSKTPRNSGFEAETTEEVVAEPESDFAKAETAVFPRDVQAAQNNKQMPRMFLLIIVGVGLAMIALIVLAGFTAWYRTRQQSELIEELNDKLLNLESQYNSASSTMGSSDSSAFIDTNPTMGIVSSSCRYKPETLTVKTDATGTISSR